jgi:uncharacterized protein (DUF927 family)
MKLKKKKSLDTIQGNKEENLNIFGRKEENEKEIGGKNFGKT